MKKSNNSYSGHTYPTALKSVFEKMQIGETVERDYLIREIWKEEPNWFIRRSFDAARTNATKGTEMKIQCRKGVLTRIK